MSLDEAEDAPEGAADGRAARVVLSYPSDLSPHAKRRIQQEYYATYLRRTRETATEGEAWEEFTDVGCCGSQEDVGLLVETVEGGPAVDEDTEFAFVERDVGEAACDWSVQNEID